MTKKEPSSKVPLEKSSRGGKQIGKLCKDYEKVPWIVIDIRAVEENIVKGG